MIPTVELHSWLQGLIQHRGLRALCPRHSAIHMWDDARVFLGQCNFPVTHLLRRTSRVITRTNCSLPRRVTAILGATGDTGQLMPRSPLSAALCIIPKPTLWGTLPSCTDVWLINHISYQMPIPCHKYSFPKLKNYVCQELLFTQHKSLKLCTIDYGEKERGAS